MAGQGSNVSLIIKYLLFGFNSVIWIVGLGLVCTGLWAWTEKETFSKIGQVTNVGTDPVFWIFIPGLAMCAIGFIGCIGSLRENTKFLIAYCVMLGLIIAAESAIAILGILYKDWFRTEIEGQLHFMIECYIDFDEESCEDSDLQDIIDWVQADWLKCCGVKGPNDWSNNIYYNCSSPGLWACGTPASCCLPPDHAGTVLIGNSLCGVNSRRNSTSWFHKSKIYNGGCLDAGDKWINNNILPIAGVITAVGLIQILGLCFAHNLRKDINSQKAQWQD